MENKKNAVSNFYCLMHDINSFKSIIHFVFMHLFHFNFKTTKIYQACSLDPIVVAAAAVAGLEGA